MSLKEEIKTFLSHSGNIAPEIADEVPNVTLVEDEIVDTTRWAIIHEAVYVRKLVGEINPDLTYLTEYVQVTYAEPATEYQEWDDLADPNAVVEVEPYEETVIKFKKKED